LVCVGPEAADNRWLREAFENRVPRIYFLGIAPGGYQAMLPTFICGTLPSVSPSFSNCEHKQNNENDRNLKLPPGGACVVGAYAPAGLMAENFILSLPGTSKLDLSRPSA
jgi:hypothetical protein